MKSGFPSHRLAFTLAELLVILAVLVLLVLLFPRLSKAQAGAQRIRCNNNLKQIALSYRQWAVDLYPMQRTLAKGGVKELIEAGYIESPFVVLSNELNSPRILWCPAARKPQAPAAFGKGLGPTNVNYFVGLDADETRPQMFLAGDDNLVVDGQPVKRGVLELSTNNTVAYSAARHRFQGNVGLADGSVQGFTSQRLQEALRNTGTNINRIAFP